MRSREKLEMATLERSSWMPYAPQEVKGLNDNDDDDDDDETDPTKYGLCDTKKTRFFVAE
jgi:hypothetical protein